MNNDWLTAPVWALKQVPALLKDLWPGLCALLRGLLRWCRRPAPRGVPRDRCCIDLPSDVYKRADPLIYAQYYLMKMGLPVTWDNPDISIFDGSVPVPPSTVLKPNHRYRVSVRVWNGSYDAPAAGVGVHLSYLSFGVATMSHPIASTQVVLGVKGSSQCPAFASFDWVTPLAKGHYCLQALLEWADDANQDNNLGQTNVLVGAALSPAHFSFRIANDASVRRAFAFEVDCYTLPVLPACDDAVPWSGRGGRLAESRARWEIALREQGRGMFTVPRDWTVSIDPAQVVLAPREERTIQVAIEPLDPAFTGARSFNVNAFAVGAHDARHLAGGVTLHVTKS